MQNIQNGSLLIVVCSTSCVRGSSRKHLKYFYPLCGIQKQSFLIHVPIFNKFAALSFQYTAEAQILIKIFHLFSEPLCGHGAYQGLVRKNSEQILTDNKVIWF
jgi:hypothetical protein